MVFNVHSTLESANEGDGDGVFALYIYFMTFRYRSIAAKTRKETDFSIWNTCHAFFHFISLSMEKMSKVCGNGRPLVIFFMCFKLFNSKTVPTIFMHSQRSMRARSQFIFLENKRTRNVVHDEKSLYRLEKRTVVIIVIEMKANKFKRTTSVFAYT